MYDSDYQKRCLLGGRWEGAFKNKHALLRNFSPAAWSRPRVVDHPSRSQLQRLRIIRSVIRCCVLIMLGKSYSCSVGAACELELGRIWEANSPAPEESTLFRRRVAAAAPMFDAGAAVRASQKSSGLVRDLNYRAISRPRSRT